MFDVENFNTFYNKMYNANNHKIKYFVHREKFAAIMKFEKFYTSQNNNAL